MNVPVFVPKGCRLVLNHVVGSPPDPNRLEHPYVGTTHHQGVEVWIENLPGSVRRGPGWAVTMSAIYGEIPNTEGMDGEPVDVFVGPAWKSDTVVIVHQRTVGGEDAGGYDEDKVMLGWRTEAEALEAYRSHYNGDPTRFVLGSTTMTIAELCDRLYRKDVGAMPLLKAGPPGGGWSLIPGGRHGGYRRPKGSGFEYWYPGQQEHAAGSGPRWERDPTRTYLDVEPGSVVDVGGRTGRYRWTPDHGPAPEMMTWVTSLSTGAHELVRRNTLTPLRHARAEPPPVAPPAAPPKPRRPQPPPPPVRDAPAAPGPKVDTPAPGARRLKVFKGSTAAPGTVLHDLEQGGFQTAQYKSSAEDRYRTGAHVPKARQAQMLREFRPLVEGAARKVARRYGITTHDRHGPTAAWEDLVGGSNVGLVMALSSYQGGTSFLFHAQRYAVVYATAQARSELGAGVSIPDRTMRMVGGFLAARHRALLRFGTTNPSPEQVAEVWALRKRDAYTGTLGRYVADGATIDQGDEPVPADPWKVRSPDGVEVGGELPGKVALAGTLAELTAAGKVEDSEWLLKLEDPQLPHHTDKVLPAGAAIRLSDQLHEVMQALPDDQRQALMMSYGLGTEDGEPASALEIADALGVSVGSADNSRRRAVKLLLERANANALQIAADKRAAVRAWLDRWNKDLPEEAQQAGPSFNDLAIKFGGDRQARAYLANVRAGNGTHAAQVLEAAANGHADPAAVRSIEATALRQRERERLEAFRRHTAVAVDAGPDREATSVETDYMLALGSGAGRLT